MANSDAYLSQPRIEEQVHLEPNDLLYYLHLISEKEAQVQSFDGQIEELGRAHKARVSELKRQKDEYLIEISVLRNLCTPIRRIPLEILTKILEFSCLPPRDSLLRHYDIISTIATVSNVCVVWKRAAAANPKLWSVFCFDTISHSNLLKDIGWAREWFARSGSVPLDVHLELRSFEFSTTPLLECILELHHRIRVLEIAGAIGKFRPLLSSPLPFPLLEIFFIRLNEWWNVAGNTPMGYLFDHYSPHKIKSLLGAPRLQQITVNDLDCETTTMLALLVLPESLTSLSWAGALRSDIRLCADALGLCKNLVKLCIEASEPDVGFTESIHSILLPRLTSLDIVFRETKGKSLLHCFTTPLLENLTIIYHGRRYCDLITDLVSFRDRSKLDTVSMFSLQSHGANEDISCADWEMILSIFPSIRTLTIGPSDFNNRDTDLDRLIQVMTCTKDDCLLPKLTAFRLFHLYHRMNSLDMMPMVLSRVCPNDSISDNGQYDRKWLDKVILWGACFEEVAQHLSELPGLEVVYYTSIYQYGHEL
ncbi:hypothetical protein BDP27DRAFT_287635 [Rhodocollybia butyracea]|uniref:F-box domain-containing protein n=1 Tax=Rhodocollybia butyracea TaxID=206335 RepID=A0A9P5PW78_9AGAR|nr:hypothetical protein BDP27DRAFT_287635 [Rhodocollybia butyracea]